MVMFAFALLASASFFTLPTAADLPRHDRGEEMILAPAEPKTLESGTARSDSIRAAAAPQPASGDMRLDRIWIPLPCTRVGKRMVC